MPRRLPVRPAKLIGNLFVLFVMAVIAMLYFTYVILLWGPRCAGTSFIWAFLESFGAQLLLAFFHVFFVLLVWSFMQAMTTDPGQVPVFWVRVATSRFRDFIWVTQKTNAEGTAWCATCSSQSGAITVLPAIGAFWTWTITALGSTIASAFGTESILCCCWDMFWSLPTT